MSGQAKRLLRVKGKEGSNSTKGEESNDGDLQPYTGKSHNKWRKRPFCDFQGVHLARHLASLHPECAETARERARLVYKADDAAKQSKGKKTTLTNPEE